MNDCEFVFKQDVREKKNVGRNAKYMNRTGKGGVRMPSDYLSRKEKKNLNGPVSTYDMGRPMTYKDFLKMPDDLQRAYLSGIIEKFHPNTRVIGDLWGVSHCTVSVHLKRLGVATAGGRGKRTNFNAAAWDAWISGGVIPTAEENDTDVPLAEVIPNTQKGAEWITTRNLTKREQILRTAEQCVMGDRQQDYGTPERNFKVIADMWNAYLGVNFILEHRLGAKDVAALLALLKIARIASGHAKADNWIDLAGYAACGGELEDGGDKND